ncbi:MULTISPECIES: putative bifunctional diguanylate cyclase/phosphodiesterase [unclassified Marinimicrobium]|jgi:diguanylate cyclase (GGDEF)-like protein/PAS domain S-box-containing protein|uniref:putative bifunctional diguanylate cyclase/phosphodiesterase n=1 Tax=unclassified Marinimicrobium TaxID=2632100 RepID=UPI00257C39AE|nr:MULTISPECIES: bifunctional diguanylate cyclase/phosphodiesterase [unclassified Marinimicrobium]
MTNEPSLFQGVSFRLAKIGIILAFLLGLLMSSVQLYLDLDNQREELNLLFSRVMEVATPPAMRAVHTLDDDLSAEVVNGLLAYDFVIGVRVTDELGNTLAEGQTAQKPSQTRWLTSLISDETRELYSDLIIPGYGQTASGGLAFTVDMDQALQAFYERSGLNLITGLVRNAMLVVLLFFAFYFVVAKPLARLSREIKSINPEEPGVRRLTPLPGRHDELAQLLDSSNQLLNAVDLSLAKRRAVELALRKSEGHLRQIIDSLPVMIGARDIEGRYLFANKALASMVGRDVDTMRGQDVRDLFRNAVDDVELILQNDQRVIRQGIDVEINEESFVTREGKKLYLQSHIMPLHYYDQTVALVVSVDITERKNAQAKMEHMAHHDALTNLPNRVQLVERLDLEIRRATRHGYCGAVLFIDLDQFKNINDSLGHPVGDKVLKEVAQRLVSSVREEDLVARLSGDEFVVVLTVLDKDLSTAALRAGEISEKIRRIISRPFHTENLDLRISCSVGVVIYPDKNSSVHELLRFADTAMYQVKEKGRDAIEFFNEDMADKVSRQLVMEGDLHRALEGKQFALHYQPKIDMGTGTIVGAEALLRWHHPTKGLISPADFIPILETSGLILDVGQWVLETACETLVHWQAQGWWKPGMRLSINISPRQFRRAAFADDVLRTLKRYPIPENSLEMEVTEGIVIQQVDEAIVTMRRLAEQGISFSLDDFGTGYSSISYLKQLPVTVLKIDQSFVRDIVDDHNDRVLVETIITMGRLLDLDVVAEGVELEAQFDILQRYGCHYYQGFYFSPGVTLSAFDAMLAEHTVSA